MTNDEKIGDLIRRANEVFGVNGEWWIHRPNIALGWKLPIDKPDEAMTILERIEHGIYS